MDINSFLTTVFAALCAGILMGFFGREITQKLYYWLHRVYSTPRRLVRYRPPAPGEQPPST